MPTAFFGGVSVDYFGTLLADTLQQEGIDTTLLKRSGRPTPLVLVSADAHGHRPRLQSAPGAGGLATPVAATHR
jgi:sugar/nucleoside kinase (ribokinase family)